jgi:arsenate reductase-like glutaredoxin family protein
MPTGYTSVVSNGGSFRDYVWSCATAFFREGEIDVTIHPYYAEAVKNCEDKLAELKTAGPKTSYEKWRETKIADNARYLNNYKVEKAQYDAMRKQVKDWVPPTVKHESLKKLMLEQLSVGAPFDVTEYYKDPPEQDPLQWFEEQVSETKKNLKRAQKELAEKEAYGRDAAEWVAALKASVP